MTTKEPPAIVQSVETAATCIAEAKAIDAVILADLGRAADGIKRRGELLLKAKEKAGHGNWQDVLKKHWPKLPARTARHYMAMVKTANLAVLTAVTHPGTDESDETSADAEEPEEAEPEPVNQDADDPPERSAPAPTPAAKPAPKPATPKQPEPEPDPATVIAEQIGTFCRELDSLKAKLKEEITGVSLRFVHLESVTFQIEAARKALWQSRPTEPCQCMKGGQEADPRCKGCFGTGKIPLCMKLRGRS